jgi:preprotein translocase subunit SecE
VTEKTAKAKQPEKTKQVPKPPARSADRDREKPKQPNALARWWRETIGELRKVAWPTVQETRRLTGIVLIVMFVMSAVLGLLDFLFSKLITLLIS